MDEASEMNFPSISLPDVLREDVLTCSVCLDFYNTPKILPCLHSFCLRCLQQLINDGSLTCPECRHPVDIGEGGVASLKDSYISSLLDLFKAKHAKDLKCAICCRLQKDVDAASRCLDCCDFLCLTCTQGHCCSIQSLDHKVVALKEFLTGQHDTEVRKRQKMMCLVHLPQPLKFFCDTCKDMICMDCRLLNHIQHQVVHMSDAVLKKKPALKALLESLSINLVKISEQEMAVQRELRKIKQSADHIRSSIDGYVNTVTAHLLSQKAAILSDLDNIVKEKTDFCLSVQQELVNQKQAAVCTQEISQKVIGTGIDCEIINLEDLITNQVRELNNFNVQCPEIQVPELLLGFDQNRIRRMKHFSLTFKQDRSLELASQANSSLSIASTSGVHSRVDSSQQAPQKPKVDHLRVKAAARHSPGRAAASRARRSSAFRDSPGRWGAAAVRGRGAHASRCNATQVVRSPVMSNPAQPRVLVSGKRLHHRASASRAGVNDKGAQQARRTTTSFPCSGICGSMN